jgi:hypothetical protein
MNHESVIDKALLGGIMENSWMNVGSDSGGIPGLGNERARYHHANRFDDADCLRWLCDGRAGCAVPGLHICAVPACR